MRNTAGIEFIRNEMGWDKYDPWASVTSSIFDLCEAWWLSERIERLSNAFDIKLATEDDMFYWLDVLDRMYTLVKLAGRDY